MNVENASALAAAATCADLIFIIQGLMDGEGRVDGHELLAIVGKMREKAWEHYVDE